MVLDETSARELKGAFHFTGACFAVSWGLVLALWLAVGPAEAGSGAAGGGALGDNQGPAFLAAWLIMTLIPGATALALGFLLKEKRTGTGRPARDWRGYVNAYLLAAGFLGLAFGASWMLGLTRLDPELNGLRSQLAVNAGWSSPASYLRTLALFSATLAPIMWALLLFAEEYGWRGYLLQRLRCFGPWPASLISGFLWAVWQLPMVLLLRLYGPASIWASCAVALAVFTALGTVLGLLALDYGSVWVPALTQAVALSHMGIYSLCFTHAQPLLGGPTGLIGLFVCGGYLAWAALAGRPRRGFPAREEEERATS